MRRLNSKLDVDFISEKGNDLSEKTYIAYTPLENYMCIAIAESYDNETGENSARIAVEAALAAFERKPSLKRIPEYIQYANQQVFMHSTRYQLKASIMVFVTDYTRMRYGVCGNTKLYGIFGNLFILSSKTQTIYQQRLDEDASKEPDVSEIHNMTSYLGKERQARPFISKKIKLTEGSVLLFATSNMWGRISGIEILDAYENTKTNEEFLDSLQELLLSLQGHNPQKIGSFTAATLSVEKVFQEDVQKEKKKKRIILFIIIGFFVILLVLCIVFLSIRAMDRKKIKEIKEYDKKGAQYVDYGNYTKALEKYELADTLADKLSLSNWQYINEKKELSETVSGRKDLLVLLQDAEAAYEGKNYEQAKKLYTQIQKEAVYQELGYIESDASQKLEEIKLYLEAAQCDALGDMYTSAGEYNDAISQYEKALELLKKTGSLDKQAEIQAKIFDIRSKQKEAKAAKEEEKKAKEEEKKAAEEEKKAKAEEKKQKAADKEIIQMNILVASANKALEEGRIARAKKLYKEVLAKYKRFSGSAEDADKVYADIAALGQAITEAEAKAIEDAEQERLKLASKYILQAREAIRDDDKKKAVKFYEKALDIYKELDIWDERTEEVYDALDELENGEG